MNEFYKEKISYYKLLLTFLITAFYGIIGWYFGTSSTMDTAMIYIVIFAVILLIISIGAVVFKTRYYINQIKEDVEC